MRFNTIMQTKSCTWLLTLQGSLANHRFHYSPPLQPFFLCHSSWRLFCFYFKTTIGYNTVFFRGVDAHAEIQAVHNAKLYLIAKLALTRRISPTKGGADEYSSAAASRSIHLGWEANGNNQTPIACLKPKKSFMHMVHASFTQKYWYSKNENLSLASVRNKSMIQLMMSMFFGVPLSISFSKVFNI